MADENTVQLTDEEWMSLINKNGDGLGICCANISALRDEIINLAGNGGEVDDFMGPELLKTYRAAADGHDFEGLTALQKLIEQVEQILGSKAADLEHQLFIIPRERERQRQQRELQRSQDQY